MTSQSFEHLPITIFEKVNTCSTFYINVKYIRSIHAFPTVPLNLITLGQTKSDNINRMITIFDEVDLLYLNKWGLEIRSQ